METQAIIHDYLRETPGASTQMVADRLGIDPSTADYHLRRLRKRGVVHAQPSGREVVWFVAGSGLCPVLRHAVPAFRRSEVAAVARVLSEYPTSASRIARETDIDPGRARWAAEVLIRVGLARKTPTGRLVLAEGADVCIQRACSGEPCALWGACAPSKSAT